jgi:two-component system, chemotaxis family, CheB/CheR fusion protein
MIVEAQTSNEIRLAAQLHDGIGQVLATALMRLKPLQRQGGAHGAAADAVGSLIEEAITQIRSFTRDLCPPVLYHGGVVPAVQWLADEMFRLRALRVEVHQASIVPGLQSNARAVLFAAIRELLINVSKHAGVMRASVELGTASGRVYAVVRDKGAGFEPAQSGLGDSQRGFGLFFIRHRVEELGGSFSIRSRPKKGTEMRITLPTSSLGSLAG